MKDRIRISIEDNNIPEIFLDERKVSLLAFSYSYAAHAGVSIQRLVAIGYVNRQERPLYITHNFINGSTRAEFPIVKE